MENTKAYHVAHLDLTIEDESVLNYVKTLLRQMKGVRSVKVVQERKSELDISFEEAREGKVIEVGSVDNLMDLLHS